MKCIDYVNNVMLWYRWLATRASSLQGPQPPAGDIAGNTVSDILIIVGADPGI